MKRYNYIALIVGMAGSLLWGGSNQQNGFMINPLAQEIINKIANRKPSLFGQHKFYQEALAWTQAELNQKAMVELQPPLERTQESASKEEESKTTRDQVHGANALGLINTVPTRDKEWFQNIKRDAAKKRNIWLGLSSIPSFLCGFAHSYWAIPLVKLVPVFPISTIIMTGIWWAAKKAAENRCRYMNMENHMSPDNPRDKNSGKQTNMFVFSAFTNYLSEQLKKTHGKNEPLLMRQTDNRQPILPYWRLAHHTLC